LIRIRISFGVTLLKVGVNRQFVNWFNLHFLGSGALLVAGEVYLTVETIEEL
jgi:hypothetical protein